MKYTYTNYSVPEDKVWNGLPKGVIFECEAADILEADKFFTDKYGFKMSDKKANRISTSAPNFYGGPLNNP